MICPNCHSPNIQTQNTRHKEPTSITRWRKCLDCLRGFKTKEIIVSEKIIIAGRECQLPRGKDGPGFEQWLTDDIPPNANLGKLREAYDAGLNREEALARARVQKVKV
jgi:hypothetical protein